MQEARLGDLCKSVREASNLEHWLGSREHRLGRREHSLGRREHSLGCREHSLGSREHSSWGRGYKDALRLFPQPELQQMMETERLRLELQMVETERVRLSLLEEKLVDVLQLLRRLQDLVGTWRVLEGRGGGRGWR